MSEIRSNLPIVSAFPDGSGNECSSCWGACCRAGTIVALTANEVETLTRHGAELAETSILRPKPARDGASRAFYEMNSDCPFLVPTVGRAALCGTYDSPDRPEACGRFEAGSQNCHEIRDEYAVAQLAALNGAT